MTTTSFKSAYGTLQRHAASLRDQSEPNIDDLLKIVTESVEAYQVCKQRIEAVESALKAALDGVSAETPTPTPVAPIAPMAPMVATPAAPPVKASRAASKAPPPVAPPATPAALDDMDDDIPF